MIWWTDYYTNNTMQTNRNLIIKMVDDSNKKKYVLIKDENEFSELISKIKNVSELSIDTETSSLNPHQADLIGISISPKVGEAYYIPLNHKNFKNLNEKNVLKNLQIILEDKSIKKIGQNIKFDYIILYHRGIDIEPLEDLSLIHISEPTRPY